MPCVSFPVQIYQQASEFASEAVAKANLEEWEPASIISGVDDVPSPGGSVGTGQKTNEIKNDIEVLIRTAEEQRMRAETEGGQRWGKGVKKKLRED